MDRVVDARLNGEKLTLRKALSPDAESSNDSKSESEQNTTPLSPQPRMPYKKLQPKRLKDITKKLSAKYSMAETEIKEEEELISSTDSQMDSSVSSTSKVVPDYKNTNTMQS